MSIHVKTANGWEELGAGALHAKTVDGWQAIGLSTTTTAVEEVVAELQAQID